MLSVASLLFFIASQHVRLAKSEASITQQGNSLVVETPNDGAFIVNTIDLIQTIFALESRLNALNATLSAQSSDLSSAKTTIESQNLRIAALEVSLLYTHASLNQIQSDVAKNQSIFLASTLSLQDNLSSINSTLSAGIDTCLKGQAAQVLNISVDHRALGGLLNKSCQPYEFESAAPTSTSSRLCQPNFWAVTLNGRSFNLPVDAGDAVFVATSYTAIYSTVGALAGDFFIQSNGILLSMTLPNIAFVGRYLQIDNNPLMTSITLPNLSFVGGDFNFVNNAKIDSIPLTMLSVVGGYLSIANNAKLTSIYLPNLCSSGVDINIVGHAALTSVFLPSVTYVGSDLQAYGNPRLTSIDLPRMAYVHETINFFANNPYLTVVPSNLNTKCHAPFKYCIRMSPIGDSGNGNCPDLNCPS